MEEQGWDGKDFFVVVVKDSVNEGKQ